MLFDLIINFVLVYMLIKSLAKIAFSEVYGFDKFKDIPALQHRNKETLKLEFFGSKASYQLKWLFLVIGSTYCLTQLYWLTPTSLILNGLFFGVFFMSQMFKSENISVLSFAINLAAFLTLIVVSEISLIAYIITSVIINVVFILKIFIEMESVKV